MSSSISDRTPPEAPIVRLRLLIRGIVQGVGFRPFVYRLARELDLVGWVANTGPGLLTEVEGYPKRLEDFRSRVADEAPAGSVIENLETVWLDAAGYRGFEIRPSLDSVGPAAWVRPDVATCAECRREVFEPADRRFRYPFTNCTHCGPRFSILEALPYDRQNTSMRTFEMCPQCQAEYADPGHRRFHAQPNACPACGPQLDLWGPEGTPLATRDDALRRAGAALREGAVVAVKGIGGFHLMVVAHDNGAVRRLRQRKHREEKPFALMFPSLEEVRQVCRVSELEAGVLQSAAAPIVLLDRVDPRSDPERPADGVAGSVAPGNPTLGVMLPYSPLHHLLLAEVGSAVVATSGNRSDEPICTDEHEARERLAGMADLFLVHNRRIVRHVDDSIVRIVAGREMVLRRARGFAPLPLPLPLPARPPTDATSPRAVFLGVGAHLKNSVALSVGRHVFVSQHMGDLDTPEALEAFRRGIADLCRLCGASPSGVAADAHPDYASTHWARESNLPVTAVQHHFAHVLSVMAENDLNGPVLGVSWDGTGYGLDGTIWGGEFLRVDGLSFERVAHLRTFPLPGGEAAAREPRRSALGLLHELAGPGTIERLPRATRRAFTDAQLNGLVSMLERAVQCPRTSSIGRLFDAVASLTGLRQKSNFEGQAAMELEFARNDVDAAGYALPPCRGSGSGWVLDWAPLVESLLADVRAQVPVGVMAGRFHRALVAAVIEVARAVGEPRVVLTGGCFQNRWLAEQTIEALRTSGFRPYWHQRVPPNDGGIALGQVMAMARQWQAVPLGAVRE